MLCRLIPRAAALCAALLLVSCISSVPGGVLVIPLTPNARHAGKTYGEWSVEWWKWALGQPVSSHPLFDTSGQYAANGQTGTVWFLGATFGDPPTVTRSITVPEGTAFFFPLFSIEEDSAFSPDLSAEEMANLISGKVGQVSQLRLSVDGVGIPDLGLTRAKSPAPFSVSLPPGGDDVYTFFGVDAGTQIETMVSDGYWVFIDPLPVGAHEITLGSTQVDGESTFSVDATYNINVVSGS
jgi:hypothetical protein